MGAQLQRVDDVAASGMTNLLERPCLVLPLAPLASPSTPSCISSLADT